MNSININSLTGKKNSTRGKIDVKSLSKVTANMTFNVSDLIVAKNKRLSKIEDIYVEEYNTCLRKITEENGKDKTDMIFTINNNFNNIYPEYSTLESLLRIEKNIENMNNGIKTYIIDDKNIFVTWYDIQE